MSHACNLITLLDRLACVFCCCCFFFNTVVSAESHPLSISVLCVAYKTKFWLSSCTFYRLAASMRTDCARTFDQQHNSANLKHSSSVFYIPCFKEISWLFSLEALLSKMLTLHVETTGERTTSVSSAQRGFRLFVKKPHTKRKSNLQHPHCRISQFVSIGSKEKNEINMGGGGGCLVV